MITPIKQVRHFLWTLVLLLSSAVVYPAADGGDPARSDAALEQAALAAMRAKAAGLKIGGVAVVALVRGDHLESWTSAMCVVGRYKDEATATAKGNNLLGIAYAKAAEMADTLKPSGHAGRPPMTGEFGWAGGAIGALPDGYVLAAFSGGKSEDDFEVSKAGVSAVNGKP